MTNHDYNFEQCLSKKKIIFYYLSIILSLIFLLFMLIFSTFCLLTESENEFFMHLMNLFASLSGLFSILLLIKRKIYGALLSPIALLISCLGTIDIGYGQQYFPGEYVIVGLLFGVPAALSLAQIPTLMRLSGAGRGLGAAWRHWPPKQASPPRAGLVSRPAKWWFRIAIALSLLVYLPMLVFFVSKTLATPSSPFHYFQPQSRLPYYLLAIAGAYGLCAVLLTALKQMAGVFWGLVPCAVVGLIPLAPVVLRPWDPGFEQRHRLNDYSWEAMLALAIVAAVMLLSQIPFLKKWKIVWGGFQKSHFADGASFRDDDMDALNAAWSSYERSFSFFLPGLTFAILAPYVWPGTLLVGVIGHLLPLAAMFGTLIIVGAALGRRRRRYLACLGRLGLTGDDVDRALRLRRRLIAGGAEKPPRAAGGGISLEKHQ